MTTTESIFIVASNPGGSATSSVATITWTPYTETLTVSPSSWTYPNGTTVQILGAVPYGTFNFSINSATYDQGPITIDGTGGYGAGTWTNTNAFAGSNPGTYTLYVRFNDTGHTRSVSNLTVLNPAAPVVTAWSLSPSAGSTGSFTTSLQATGTNLTSFTIYLGGPASSSYPNSLGSPSPSVSSGTTFNVAASTTPWSAYFTVTDAYGQTATSSTIYHTEYFPSGTAKSGPYCNGFTKQQDYWNGSGGTYTTVLAYNDGPLCGYVPPPSTPTLTASYSFYDATGDSNFVVEISWSTTNATSTSAPFAGWSNGTSGTWSSLNNYGFLAAGPYGPYTITATGAGGSVSKSATLSPGSGSFT